MTTRPTHQLPQYDDCRSMPKYTDRLDVRILVLYPPEKDPEKQVHPIPQLVNVLSSTRRVDGALVVGEGKVLVKAVGTGARVQSWHQLTHDSPSPDPLLALENHSPTPSSTCTGNPNLLANGSAVWRQR